ncbi:MAG: M1 family aminopeptidase [Ignavibacteriales bacterium]|nr:M1 family aminopeptidase [Ignavibacteriales bacterium]
MHLRKVADSGGPLLREQAAYDVLFYRLKFTIDTAAKSITGGTFVRALATDTLSTFVLDLSSTFTVQSVIWKGQRQYNTPLLFNRPTGRLWIALPYVVQRSDSILVEINYQGTPKVSTNPPWDGGFVWNRTKTGEVWAGVACEEEGGDAWWPCKDHPSDEPDSVDLYFTVPASLTCVSNGRLLGVTDAGSLKTFHWYVSEPINNYCITFYLGPLQRISINYTSVTGQAIPGEYWFLPYNVAKAQQYSSIFLKDLRFFEEVCGPFPFRAEKYCIVDAPYWGMEHQTCVAYGNNFVLNSYGFDYIHLHELAHEWWGNLVTAKDWSDVWIHEGFATYMEALFVERTLGIALYKSYMSDMRGSIQNVKPVAPDFPTTAQSMFSSNDVYFKGAWILHTLRHYLGDQAFFSMFRRFAYPDPAMESVTDGRQCRLATTNDFLGIAEQVTGKKLDWFFNLYFRQPTLPKLRYSRNGTGLSLQWITPNNLPFPFPVDIRVGTKTVVVDMQNGSGTVSVPTDTSYQIDPDNWILMGTPQLTNITEQNIPTEFTVGVYPNPFNPTTTLRLEIPKRMHVSAELVSITGQRIAEIVNDTFEPGTHSVPINCTCLSSGAYFVVVRGDENVLTEKIVLLR